MKYTRILSEELTNFIADEKIKWLVNFVKQRDDLDFQTGDKWISIYRGLSRIVKITKSRGLNKFKLTAHEKYVAEEPGLFEKDMIEDYQEEVMKPQLISLIKKVELNKKIDFYKKEGVGQTLFSKSYGLNNKNNHDFLIFDKEVVIGFENKMVKDEYLGKLKQKYQQFLIKLPDEYGTTKNQKSLGTELDFLGIDKDGYIMVVEFKDGSSTSGIYLAPCQVAMYLEIIKDNFNENPKNAESNIFKIIHQKKLAGLLPEDWKVPQKIIGFKPIIITYNLKRNSTAIAKYNDVLSKLNSFLSNGLLKDIELWDFTDTPTVKLKNI